MILIRIAIAVLALTVLALGIVNIMQRGNDYRKQKLKELLKEGDDNE